MREEIGRAGFKREVRYFVVKAKNLNSWQKEALFATFAEAGIETVECVVVEHDWPNYEHVWQTVEQVANGTWQALQHKGEAEHIGVIDMGRFPPITFRDDLVRQDLSRFNGQSVFVGNVPEANPQPAVPDSIVEVLERALWVAACRSGDVSTEDGSFATTDLDQIIGLEQALCEAFPTGSDNVCIDKMMPQIKSLLSAGKGGEA